MPLLCVIGRAFASSAIIATAMVVRSAVRILWEVQAFYFAYVISRWYSKKGKVISTGCRRSIVYMRLERAHKSARALAL